MDIQATTTVGAVKARWADAAAGVFTGRALVKALRKIGLKLQGTIIRRLNHRGQSWEYGYLNRRTANLQRSVFYRLEQDGGDVIVRAGVNLLRARYGRIQELGGTIQRRSKKGRSWQIRIRPTGYIASSLQDERGYIQDQLGLAASEITEEITRGSTG